MMIFALISATFSAKISPHEYMYTALMPLMLIENRFRLRLLRCRRFRIFRASLHQSRNSRDGQYGERAGNSPAQHRLRGSSPLGRDASTFRSSLLFLHRAARFCHEARPSMIASSGREPIGDERVFKPRTLLFELTGNAAD